LPGRRIGMWIAISIASILFVSTIALSLALITSQEAESRMRERLNRAIENATVVNDSPKPVRYVVVYREGGYRGDIEYEDVSSVKLIRDRISFMQRGEPIMITGVRGYEEYLDFGKKVAT
jgi:hypothetical protein